MLAGSFGQPLRAQRWACRLRATGARVHVVGSFAAGLAVPVAARAGSVLVTGPGLPGLPGWWLPTRGAGPADAPSLVVACDDEVTDENLDGDCDWVPAEATWWAASAPLARRIRERRPRAAPTLAPPVVDEHVFAPRRSPIGTLPRPVGTGGALPRPVIACTALPSWRAGAEDLLLATAHLREGGWPGSLVLLDDGSEGAAAARFHAEDLALGAVVGFAPARSLAHLAAILTAADGFALAAVSDGAWPEVGEAVACRLPVAVTDVAGARRRVDPRLPHRVVNRRDPAGLAEAIAELVPRPGALAAEPLRWRSCG